ncbi:MAG: hypothetical protein ABIV25_04420 [Paracoccaceae bacterium]
MSRIFVMLMLLTGAAALPAAAMVTGMVDFPHTQDDGVAVILVQSCGEGGCSSQCVGSCDSARPGTTPSLPPGVSADAVGISPPATKTITDALAHSVAFCESLGDPRLNIDCLSDQYRFIAQQLAYDSGYSGIRNALLVASDKLHQLARDNRAEGPKLRPLKNGETPHRNLVPVKDPAAVAVQAEAIVAEASTVLLRSSSGSDQRRIAYEQVAAVVNSSKVLLRSA